MQISLSAIEGFLVADGKGKMSTTYMNENMSSSRILSDERILIGFQILIEQHCRASIEVERCRSHLSEPAAKSTGIGLDAVLEESCQSVDDKLSSFFFGLLLDTMDRFLLRLNIVRQM